MCNVPYILNGMDTRRGSDGGGTTLCKFKCAQYAPRLTTEFSWSEILRNREGFLAVNLFRMVWNRDLNGRRFMCDSHQPYPSEYPMCFTSINYNTKFRINFYVHRVMLCACVPVREPMCFHTFASFTAWR